VNPVTEAQSQLTDSMYDMYGAVSDVARINAIPLVGTYPTTSLGPCLRDIAKCIKDRVQRGAVTNALYATAPIESLDTHADQAADLPPILGMLAQSIAALVSDLKDMGAWEHTTIALISEFGRTNRPNSGDDGATAPGTEHGAGFTLLTLGGEISGGSNAVVGPAYTANELTSRNWIRPEIDFRSVYWELLAHMGFDPSTTLTETFQRSVLGLYS